MGGVRDLILFLCLLLSFEANSKATKFCLDHLTSTTVGIKRSEFSSAVNEVEKVITQKEASKPHQVEEQLATLGSWLELKDQRPDLVVAGVVRLLDSVTNKELPKLEVAQLIAKHFADILEITAVEDSYRYFHAKLNGFLLTSLDVESFAKIADVVLAHRAKRNTKYKFEVLSQLEQLLLSFGYKKGYYRYLSFPQGSKQQAAYKWNRLRSGHLDDIDVTSGVEMGTLMLTEKSFASQFSHHLAQWRAYLNTDNLVTLLDSDPFSSSRLSMDIQREVFQLAQPEGASIPAAMMPDFTTHLALKYISRTFVLMKAENNFGHALEAFFDFFEKPNLERQESYDFINDLSSRYASFINLAVAWENVILWNLESKSQWAVPEDKLLEQARLVPDFIFHLVYQETRNTRLLSFMEKLAALR
ncbi:MAG: hypothetical protein R3A80_11620 [Bdellovibrionota bacterium]